VKAQLIVAQEVSALSPEGLAELRREAGIGMHASLPEVLKVLHHNPTDRIEIRMETRNRYQRAVPYFRAGMVFEHPQAYLQVQNGVAIPADEACAERAGMTVEQMEKAQHAQRRLMAGIMPEDFSLYDAGIVTGYDGDGNFKPGENWEQRHTLAPERFPANLNTGVNDDAETARALAGL
jgi:hypothetical protein